VRLTGDFVALFEDIREQHLMQPATELGIARITGMTFAAHRSVTYFGWPVSVENVS